MRTCDLDYSQHDFQFQRRWFVNRNLETFREYVLPQWQGKPCVYLEIGTFEGMSVAWMLQHVLTHPESRAVCCDPWLITTKLDSEFMEGVYKRAQHNTAPWRNRCQLIRGNSAEVLRRMQSKGHAGIGKQSVDLCMIDGNHWAPYVADDLANCFELVKQGGWIIADDVENVHEKANHVKQGLAQWLADNPGKVRQVWKHRFCECYEKL